MSDTINNNVVKNQLESDERLYWNGQPVQGMKLTPIDVLLVPFSLFWGGSAIFWELAVFVVGAPFFFKLFGIPFVIVGLYLIIGRFFVVAKHRSNTYYGVTNKRIIIMSGLVSQTIHSLQLDSLAEISINSKSNGKGTITFGRSNPLVSMLNNALWPGIGRHAAPSFYLISDVKKVIDIIRESQMKLKS